MKKGIYFLCGVVLSFSTLAQNKSLFEKHWFVQNGDTLPYRLLLPENYDNTKSYPLVIFLHGRGESGNDNEKQLTNGAALFLRDSIRRNYPAIVIFPQCGANSYWSNTQTEIRDSINSKRTFYFTEAGETSKAMRLLLGLTDNLFLRYKINMRRVYAGGLSMGGMGTYELVRRRPGTFAAAFAICGGAHPGTARQMSKTAWWLFHGLKDDVVNPGFTMQMEKALKTAKAKIKATYYAGANHNSWDSAFAEPGLMSWLFKQEANK